MIVLPINMDDRKRNGYDAKKSVKSSSMRGNNMLHGKYRTHNLCTQKKRDTMTKKTRKAAKMYP